MDMEAVRLVQNDGSTGVVTLTVLDALSLTELEGLLEFRHVFFVDRIPVSGKLDEDMSLRSRLTHQAEDARVVAQSSVARVLNATHNRLLPCGWSIDKPSWIKERSSTQVPSARGMPPEGKTVTLRER